VVVLQAVGGRWEEVDLPMTDLLMTMRAMIMPRIERGKEKKRQGGVRHFWMRLRGAGRGLEVVGQVERL